jgi:hypothetical protein
LPEEAPKPGIIRRSADPKKSSVFVCPVGYHEGQTRRDRGRK